MDPIFIPLPFSYKKPDAELWVFNITSLPIPPRKIKDQQMIIFGPGAVGGNHKHPRTEWFMAMSAGVMLYWLDTDGKLQEREMSSKKDELMLVEVPPFVPHAVKNISSNEKIIVVEFADNKLNETEFVEVI